MAADRPSKSTDTAGCVALLDGIELPVQSDALSERIEASGILPVVVDAMGGDDAPATVVEGARAAFEKRGIPVVLIGRPDEIVDAGEIPIVEATEVVAMDADAGSSVRKFKDSSLVRVAEAVRDGWASAMVGGGNTGATMASALLRMGRLKGIARPAIAIPVPAPGGPPTVMLDAGANSEVQPEWLVQFAQMGAVMARARFGVETPRIGLLSIGEESGKGTALVKDSNRLMSEAGCFDAAGATFVGNVEGRDLMSPDLHVVVTDGFTGNVALKTLEGALSGILTTLEMILATDPEVAKSADSVRALVRRLLDELDPESRGGAMLLGVRGVCIITHGSSSPWAIENAISLAQDMARADLVTELANAVS